MWPASRNAVVVVVAALVLLAGFLLRLSFAPKVTVVIVVALEHLHVESVRYM